MATRRNMLLGGAVLGAVAVSGCTSNATPNTAQTKGADTNNPNAAPGKKVTIGFSAPAADHGWIAAITNNAKAQADAFEDVKLNAVEGSNDVNTQVTQMQQL